MAAEQNLQTLRDFLAQYTAITEHCFTNCINDFGSRTVNDKEEKCTNNCLDKFLKMSQRMSLRFQEHQMIIAQANGAPVS